MGAQNPARTNTTSLSSSTEGLVNSSDAASNRVITPHVQAQLLLHAPQGVVPGQTVWLGLHITHQPAWHTYWMNPGDSGLATTLQWTLPPGLTTGAIAWPMPHKIWLGDLVNYGYEGATMLVIPVTVGADFAVDKAAATTIGLQSTWLVCRTECIPETGQFTLTLPNNSNPITQHASAFDAAQAALPVALEIPSHHTDTDHRAQVDGDRLLLRISHLPAAWQGKALDWIPEASGVIHPPASWTQQWQGAVWTANVPLSPFRSASPVPLAVVVTLAPTDARGSRLLPSDPVSATPHTASTANITDTTGTPHAIRTELAVPHGWPAVAAPAGIPPALQAALDQAAQEQAQKNATAVSPVSPQVFVIALASALLGGLLLNLMPCVLPVLAIKVMGLAQHQPGRTQRMAGVAYTVGVVLSFVALGAFMLTLRAAGQAVGWGFQLQSPAVVAALAVLFTLLALNLAGVFEVGSLLPSRVASLQARNPITDALLTGVLTVAIASPCTAPFMGASLGLTATLPTGQALAIFAALGLGLALPFVAASWLPATARWLPRPGAWMQTLRQFMAFPMLATVVWLLWVLGQQTGADGAMALLAILVATSLLAWALGCGSRNLRHRSAQWMLRAISAIVLAFVVWAWLPHALRSLPPVSTADTAHAAEQAHNATAWQAWRPGLPEQLVAQGQPVLVDYTAAWCVTCQFNKRTTLDDAALLADLRKRNVALLRADWTLRNPDITASLAQLGRSGVPVYVLHRPGNTPLVLSEIISVNQVQEALATLDQGAKNTP